jgi:hypothetical protein
MANQLKIFYQCMGTECQKLESLLLGVIETRESIEPAEQNKQFLPTKPVVLIDTEQSKPSQLIKQSESVTVAPNEKGRAVPIQEFIPDLDEMIAEDQAMLQEQEEMLLRDQEQPDQIITDQKKPEAVSFNNDKAEIKPATKSKQMDSEGDIDDTGKPVINFGVFKRAPDEIYSDPEVRDLPLDQRVIALRSPCGTGKTKALTRLLLQLYTQAGSADKAPRIVFVTHRRAVSQKAVETLPILNNCHWIHYQDIKGPINVNEHPLIVIQYESLGRLTGYENSTDKFVLVLDEFNSICHQMHGTFGDPISAQLCFYDLNQTSAHVIAMDGYLDQDRLDILELYTQSHAYLIHNQINSRRNQAIRDYV